MADNEASIVKEFRNLYDYVCNLGKCINQIYSRLEHIEKTINEISLNHSDFVSENTQEITNIRENMVNKDEFNDFIERMKISIGDILPPLPSLEKEITAGEENPQEAINQ